MARTPANGREVRLGLRGVRSLNALSIFIVGRRCRGRDCILHRGALHSRRLCRSACCCALQLHSLEAFQRASHTRFRRSDRQCRNLGPRRRQPSDCGKYCPHACMALFGKGPAGTERPQGGLEQIVCRSSLGSAIRHCSRRSVLHSERRVRGLARATLARSSPSRVCIANPEWRHKPCVLFRNELRVQKSVRVLLLGFRGVAPRLEAALRVRRNPSWYCNANRRCGRSRRTAFHIRPRAQTLVLAVGQSLSEVKRPKPCPWHEPSWSELGPEDPLCAQRHHRRQDPLRKRRPGPLAQRPSGPFPMSQAAGRQVGKPR